MPLRFLLAFSFFFATAFLHAQLDTGLARAGTRLQANSIQVTRFTMPQDEPGRNVLVLEVPFAQPQFMRPALAAAAKGKVIEKVQLVYTTFAVSPSFDQQGLNRKRLKNLRALLPGAFTSPLTLWELVGQTGATSPEEGKEYFHGFVITWRAEASPELVKKEMLLLDSLFLTIAGGGVPGDGTGTTPPDSGSFARVLTLFDGTKITLDRDIPEDSLWMFIKPSGPGFSVVHAKYGDSAHTVIVVTEMTEMGVKRKRVWKLEEHKGPLRSRGGFEFNRNDPDSVVLTAMGRNGWQNMLVVCDVTGSMSPYTAQIFSWLPGALTSGKCAAFVFFNDGDKKGTGQKNIGKTGGIYGTKSMRFDSVYHTARKTMNAGDGGDLPENNVEALIWSIRNMPSNGDVVLIADNWATPRDLSLFEKINRPVHIILCGARGGVNPEYLFLARQTGGSIHTVDQDITNLSEMKEGDTVKIGPHTFVLVDEHFIALEMFNTL